MFEKQGKPSLECKALRLLTRRRPALRARRNANRRSKENNIARGNFIIVDHGGGIVTLYQHGQNGSIRVSAGQNVSKGQTIMGVGSTGYSTGNHLHFEVWENGTPVNPISYVQG